MTALLTGSVWLWWLAGTALWSYIGVLAASSTGIPLVVGALTGAIGWFLGVAVVSLVGALRPASVRARQGLNTEGAALHGWTAPALLALVVVGGLGMAVSAFLPWGSGVVGWGLNDPAESGWTGSWAPMDFTPAGLVLVASGLIVVGLGVLALRRNRGRWLALAVMVATGWLTVALQIGLSISGTASLSEMTSAASQQHVLALVKAGDGLLAVCAGAACVVVWGLLSAASLVGDRRVR